VFSMKDYPIHPIKELKFGDKLSDLYSLFYSEVERRGKELSACNKKDVGEIVSNIVKSEDNWGFFIGDPENIVGFISCKRYTNATSDYIRSGDVEIESFVCEGYRGQGLGTFLKKVAINSVSEMSNGKPARVLSFVEKNNAINLSVLEKVGFSRIGDADYTGDSNREYSIYVKKIS